MLRLAGTRNPLRVLNTLRSARKAAASSIADLVPPPIGSRDAPTEQAAGLSEIQPPPAEPPTETSADATMSSPSSSNTDSPTLSGVPAALPRSNNGQSTEHISPIIPFDTHRFYKTLEEAFEPPIARTLMKATRGLLVDRIRQTTKDALHLKDFDNGAYLFRAALSELRTELTMRTRKESATLRTALTALRKEVDIVDAKMKEDIATLKHEIQMDTNSRKTESRAESKMAELAMEDFNHRTIVRISDLRTEIEQAKWDNTRRGVIIIATFVIVVILSMEMAPKRPTPQPPAPPPPIVVERPLPNIRELESQATTEDEGPR